MNTEQEPVEPLQWRFSQRRISFFLHVLLWFWADSSQANLELDNYLCLTYAGECHNKLYK